MEKTLIIGSILLVLMFFYVGKTEISFNPFNIQIQCWWKGLGAVLIIIGVVLITSANLKEGYEDGYKEGYKKGIENTIKSVVNKDEE